MHALTRWKHTCDETLVRRLFAASARVAGEHTLESGSLPHVLDEYERAAHKPMLQEDVVKQVRTFAEEHPSLPIDCSEFLEMVRGLESETDAGSSARGDAAPPSGAASASSSSSVGSEADSVLEDDATVHADSTADTSGMSLGSDAGGSDNGVLRSKLHMANTALERLHAQHEVLMTRNHEREAQQEREVHRLRRDLRAADVERHRLQARVAELEPHVAELQRKYAEAHHTCHTLESQLRTQRDRVQALEQESTERGEEVEAMRAHLVTLEQDTAELRRTCEAQREAIAGLEGVVSALEDAHAALERIRNERDTYERMHEELQLELAEVRQGKRGDGPGEAGHSLEEELGGVGREGDEVPGDETVGEKADGSGSPVEAEPADEAKPEEAEPVDEVQPAEASPSSSKAHETDEADVASPPTESAMLEDQPAENPTLPQPAKPAPAEPEKPIEAAEPSQAELFSTGYPPPSSSFAPASRSLGFLSGRPSAWPMLLLGIWLGIWISYLSMAVFPPPSNAAAWNWANQLPNGPGAVLDDARTWFDLYLGRP